jgi:L-lactate dehydrogenase complex protein LldG
VSTDHGSTDHGSTDHGSTAKEELLARIRTALGPQPPAPPPIPRMYAVRGVAAPGDPALLDLLTDRLVDYRATVRRCTAADLPAVLAAALGERGARRLVVPAGLPPQWLGGWDGEAVPDDPAQPLAVTHLDDLDGVVTGCAVAIAVTGTLVLDGSPICGRRAITLVPDYHLVVVTAAQVVASVPEGLALLDPARPLTLVSGPSATSDIELDRVEGVHGPRTLDVVLVS